MSIESDPAMREQLLGYLLGALDAAEQEAVERELETNLLMRKELEFLARSLEPLRADREHHAPPAGLAARTCEIVVAYVETNEYRAGSSDDKSFASDDTVREEAEDISYVTPLRESLPTPRRAKAEPTREVMPASLTAGEGGGTRGVTLSDSIAIAGVCAAAAVLFFPAISTSRFNAQLAQCQNNLKEMGLALGGFSRANNGEFPAVPVKGNFAAAGIYAPILADKQLLVDHRRVLCPSSDLARDDEHFQLPSLMEIEQATGKELSEMQRRMGGSYGYSLGYLSDGKHHAPRDHGRAHYALMADAPDKHRGNLSSNHGGCGQNVLFEDGHVAYLTKCTGEGRDDFFLNDRGEVAAGVHEDDAVVAGSSVPPMPFALPMLAP